MLATLANCSGSGLRVALQPRNQLEDFFGAHARAAARGYRAAGSDEAYAWKVAVGPGIDAANGPQHEASDNERKDVGFRAPNYTVFAWCWCARSSQSLRLVAASSGGLAVEGHHRRRHARNPDDMGAPAFFGDPRHFDDEGSAGNSSFKTVPHDSYEFRKMKMRSTEILRSATGETSETKYEGGRRSPDRGDSRRIL